MSTFSGLLPNFLNISVNNNVKNNTHPRFAGSGPGFAEHTKISSLNVIEGKRKRIVNPMHGNDNKRDILVTNSLKKRGEVTPQAKVAILLDLNAEIAKSKDESLVNNKKAKTKVKCLDKVAQYYKISRSTVQRIEKNLKNGKPLFKVKKSGRPRLITKLMEKKFDETWESICGPL